MSNKTKTVLVTGDVIVDHHIYQGVRATPAASGKLGTVERHTGGGALLLDELLTDIGQLAAKTQSSYSVVSGVKRDGLDCFPSGLHGYGVWQLYATDKKCKDKVWRLAQPLGYGEQKDRSPIPPFDSETLKTPADIVVLDDGGLGFRVSNAADAWPICLRDAESPPPQWVVIKMAHPIADGDLWRTVTSERFAGQTVLVASIEDICRMEVRITSGISWERTALDLVYELLNNPALSPLLKCQHCIISFGSEGALHVDMSNREAPMCRLIFDPEHMEGDWSESRGIEGGVFGFMSCLTAAIVSHLAGGEATDPVGQGIKAGISAMRVMHRNGHGEVGKGEPQIPINEIASEILAPKEAFASVLVPVPGEDGGAMFRSWAIMAGQSATDDVPKEPLLGIARRVALLGPAALDDIPFQRFGDLFTVDRNEIESLRNLRQLIRDYDNLDKGKKPLSVAVFGAPGSGKSFSVKQIAKAVLDDKVPILEFNLSQFSDTRELIGALHQVRDKVLKGSMPVVFWDEFDSNKFKWLQYLLAPMQDGAFQEGQIVHPIGKCVFVFAGGTSCDFENFGPPKGTTDEYEQFKLAKGPDFKSRLSGYLNVLGPNQRQTYDANSSEWIDDPTDICFPVRRALLLRVFLKHFGNQRLWIDRGVLSALLEIDRYKHGTRSMENVINQMVTRGAAGQVRRSDLPPAEVMSMHADYDKFMSIANRDLKFMTHADTLAPAIHEYYRELSPSPKTDMPYDELAENYKADNIAAAQRLPFIVGLIGLYVVPADTATSDTDDEIHHLIENYLELLAEAEHDGWMDCKLANGWTFGPKRDDDLRIHHLLKPYADLTEEQKDKDRDSVRHYPAILVGIDYKIVSSLPREQKVST